MKHRWAPMMALAIFFPWCGRASAQVIADQPSITLDAAVKMVDACESLAKSKGWKVTIWVIDESEMAVHMKHMEGAPVVGIQIALLKAKTSRMWRSSTDPADAKSQIATTAKEPRGQIASVLLGSLPDPGGLPVMTGGKLVGAVGVSGAGSPSDAQCAQAGLDAILKK